MNEADVDYEQAALCAENIMNGVDFMIEQYFED